MDKKKQCVLTDKTMGDISTHMKKKLSSCRNWTIEVMCL